MKADSTVWTFVYAAWKLEDQRYESEVLRGRSSKLQPREQHRGFADSAPREVSIARIQSRYLFMRWYWSAAFTPLQATHRRVLTLRIESAWAIARRSGVNAALRRLTKPHRYGPAEKRGTICGSWAQSAGFDYEDERRRTGSSKLQHPASREASIPKIQIREPGDYD